MTTFVDTSAFVTLLDDADERFARASRWIDEVAVEHAEPLITHNYVVAETIAVVQRRLGNPATRAFVDHLLPVCELRFAGRDLHDRATVAYLAGLTRKTSFVDRVSFELMRMEGIQRAFAFDDDFGRAGFETVP